jgi:hypothetical protein
MRTIGNIISVTVVTLGVLCCIVDLSGSPIDDLGSPSQEKRDTAAKVLRETYNPPPRTNWDALVSALKIGTPQSVVEAQLRSSNFAVSESTSIGSTDVKRYRLDDLWLLHCTFTNTMSGLTNRALDEVMLKEQLREIWVEPATNFTGIWRTYWVNGHPSQEFHYKDGRWHGELVSFSRVGTKSAVLHATNGVREGECIGFHPSGHIAYKGQFKDDREVGRWIWYKEDGSIELQKDYGSK